MAYDWLHFFQESTKSHISQGEYRLLLMDGHSSHKTYKFIQFCEKHYIILHCFPPHTTHLLQPLDGQPFQVYKEYFRQYNNATIQWGGSIKEKRDFLCGINNIRQLTFKSRTIRSAFAKRGIYPVDSSIVVEPLKEALPEIPILKKYTGNTPPSSLITNSPPTTVRKLRHSINKAQGALNELNNDLDLISPQLNKRLEHIFKGSLIQAELNAQRENDMQQILRNREHLKTKKTRQQIRTRGALFVRDANRRIKAREVEDIEKEWKQLRRENILDTQALTTNTQHNRSLGDSPIQEPSVTAEDMSENLFWIDSTGMR